MREHHYYHPLLVWAVVTKMRKGMKVSSVEREYGIPAWTASNWLHASCQFDSFRSDWKQHD